MSRCLPGRMVAVALLCALGVGTDLARADSITYALTASWQKIASAGQSVDVQNANGAGYAVLSTATGGPPGGTGGQALGPGEHRFYTLSADLYALGAIPVVVTNGFSGPGTAANPLPVATPVPGAIVTGQIRIATTGTAVQLPANTLVNGIALKARAGNVANGLVGPAGVNVTYDGTGAGFPVEPGGTASFAVGNSNAVWVNGTAGDVFSFEGN